MTRLTRHHTHAAEAAGRVALRGGAEAWHPVRKNGRRLAALLVAVVLASTVVVLTALSLPGIRVDVWLPHAGGTGPLGLALSGDWRTVGTRARLFRQLFDIHYDAVVHGIESQQPASQTNDVSGSSRGAVDVDFDAREVAASRVADATATLERIMFPWLRGAASLDMLLATRGRGIVIAAGSKHALAAKLTVLAIRATGSHIPVQIAYAGPRDLGETEHDMLASLAGVAMLDMLDPFDLRNVVGLRGSGFKAFAAVASTFREVAVIDAGTVFLQPPEVLFEMRDFRSTGAMLFRDFAQANNSLNATAGVRGILSDFAAPFEGRLLLNDSRVVLGEATGEMDDGVIVWDKLRVLPAMLVACEMSRTLQGSKVQSPARSDSDSAWLAHEATRIPFGVAPGFDGAVGSA
ncbi:hypothetical protein HK105_205523 [Polyrhizophydium stewartii]|uniref:Uncharacterized protein n=1 Tax=Polyrhizophydium stewartii TaxID=2732419 RepID=A0ABR4N646_9FUNG